MSIPIRRISVTADESILNPSKAFTSIFLHPKQMLKHALLKASVLAVRVSVFSLAAFLLAIEGTCQDESSPAVSSVKQPPVSKVKTDIPIQTKRDLVFAEGDGYTLRADMYRPLSNEICPVVIMIHGGAWISGDKWNVADHAKQMAKSGFVVMAINYRLSPKFLWPAHLEDCYSALAWVQKNADEWKADLNRVSTWGYSAGAHLALMTAVNPRESLPKIRAVVAGGAPCDLTFIPKDTRALVSFLGGTRADVPDQYRDASPLTFVSSDDPPVYFFHGDDDFVVPLSNSLKMRDALLTCGVNATHNIVTGKGHLLAFLDQESRLQAIAFLKQHLK